MPSQVWLIPICFFFFSMLEHRINLTQNLSLQCEFKSMQMHASEDSNVKLMNPTDNMVNIDLLLHLANVTTHATIKRTDEVHHSMHSLIQIGTSAACDLQKTCAPIAMLQPYQQLPAHT
jgi:hypothetical protein